jgi:hypothetical protein
LVAAVSLIYVSTVLVALFVLVVLP